MNGFGLRYLMHFFLSLKSASSCERQNAGMRPMPCAGRSMPQGTGWKTRPRDHEYESYKSRLQVEVRVKPEVLCQTRATRIVVKCSLLNLSA